VRYRKGINQKIQAKIKKYESYLSKLEFFLMKTISYVDNIDLFDMLKQIRGNKKPISVSRFKGDNKKRNLLKGLKNK